MKSIYVTRHAVKRLRARTKTPMHISRADMVRDVIERLKGRDAQITACIKSGKAFEVEGEAFYLCPLYGSDGEALLLKSYWAGDATGLRKLKLLVKRFLLRHLNEW